MDWLSRPPLDAQSGLGKDGIEIAVPQDYAVLRTMFHISNAVLRANYFDELLEVIAEQALGALGAASLSISRWERDSDVLRTLINAGDLMPGEQRWPEAETYPVTSDDLLSALLQHGRSYVHAVDDPSSDETVVDNLRRIGKESEIAVPIMFNDAMWGELWATGVAGRRFGHSDVQLLQAIAAYISVALGRGELLSAVWRDAHLDPLTGLANRRALEAHFAEVDWSAATPVLLVGDLDHFKSVNDNDGHAAGDALLREVAEALRRRTIAIDQAMPVRIGGDEFCVFMPRGDLVTAEVLARNISLDLKGSSITITWGAAEAGAQARSGPALLAAADAALLRAKSQGRNRFSRDTATVYALPRSRTGPATAGVEGLIERVAQIVNRHRPLPILTALEILAVEARNAIDAAGWAVSYTDEDWLITHRGADNIHDLASGLCVVRSDALTGPYKLSDFPATQRAIATESAFVASLDLDDSDPAENQALRNLGYRAVAISGATETIRGYLIEIYSVDGHIFLQQLLPSLQVLMQFCLRMARESGVTTYKP